jgi:hypothetical protein
MTKARTSRASHTSGRRAASFTAALVGLALSGCMRDQEQLTDPGKHAPSFSVAGGQQPGLDSAIAVHRRHTMRLIANPGVVGTAVGVTAGGRLAIKIFTKHGGVAGLPDNLEGIPVEVQVTGEFFASICTPSTCTNTDVWPLPVPIGVSTSSDAPASCGATGTIGARVKGGGAVYALSNNHIYADENRVPVGTSALQPGRFDTNCSSTGSNVIGTLSAYAPLAFCGASCPNNAIDAAIAVSDVTRLDNKTPPAGYGTPSSVIWAPVGLGLGVKKYGRTTSLTAGQVTGIDATVDVGYSSGTARFVHQVVIGNCPTVCSRGGDSGSLWVTNDPSANPVGLHFAGNDAGSLAIANQIGDVLTYFGIVVDGHPDPSASGGMDTTSACNHGGFGGSRTCFATVAAVSAAGSNALTLWYVPAGPPGGPPPCANPVGSFCTAQIKLRQ